MNDIIPYEITVPAKVLEKRITEALDKAETPQDAINVADGCKMLKHHPALHLVSEEHRHEIWWGEVLAYWKAADLLDGMPKQGRGRPEETSQLATFSDLGLDRREVHRWRRLHEGFTWDAIVALKDDIKLPGLNTLLSRIPSETILVIPSPGRYPIIYADPPWKYDFAQYGDVAIKGYHTLDVAEIIDFEIEGKLLKENYFDKNAVLFLWATNPKLVEALQVMAGWGFEYKTNICWDKMKATSSTMGKWLMGRHELLLIGTKGKMPPPNPDRKIESIYQEEKTGHSKKPEFFYDLIEGWYALPEEAKYLELFSRSKHGEKWEVLGNQVA
jgi:N6-adenosine-specific RNA methylase IME4